MDPPSYDADCDAGENGWAGSRRGPREVQTNWLARTIEAEIIPRLMLAHRDSMAALADAPYDDTRPLDEDVETLAQLAIGRDPGAAGAHVARLRERGVPLERIYLELLAPAARRLGVLWEADLCPFADVTVGLWRLQRLLHQLGPEFQAGVDATWGARRAILVPVPGSQHTMGLFMVAEFFRRAGWDVWGDAMASREDIEQTAREEWFDLLGLSIGSIVHEPDLASVILRVRKISRNPSLVVIVGGPIVNADPDLAGRVGAAPTACDAPGAVRCAEAMLAARSMQS